LPDVRATVDEILAADAVTLFAERAEQSGGALDLDGDGAATVAQLCRRLDGIPLAIELAAARTRMMSPQEIAGRLDERFRFLTGGSRTAVERHQTLRHAVDWSYDLLDERERTILDRLGVFSGGFTLDAAEAVVGDGDLDPLDVLDGITQLVDKSLVVAERGRRDTRYRLLETIRQYALERLGDGRETDTMRRHHATWCAGFIAHASVGVHGEDEYAWLARLDREIDNIRAALTWATGADDAHLCLSLIGDFGYWNLYSRHLGYLLAPWAAAALETTGAVEDPRFASVLAVQAVDHIHHQRIGEAERDARWAIDLIVDHGSPFNTDPWCTLCNALIFAGRATEFEGADALVDAARATGDDYTIASALAQVAVWWYVLDNAERCVPLAEEALRSAQRTGNPTMLAQAGAFLGGALETTDPSRARSILETAIEHGNSVGCGLPVNAARGWLARLGGVAGNPQWAAVTRSTLAQSYEAGDSRSVFAFLDNYTQGLANTDRVESAAILHASLGELAPHLSNPISVAHRRETRERLRTQIGDERLTELETCGSTLGYDETVALALAELDRVRANN
jgi:hypothetical protein